MNEMRISLTKRLQKAVYSPKQLGFFFFSRRYMDRKSSKTFIIENQFLLSLIESISVARAREKEI